MSSINDTLNALIDVASGATPHLSPAEWDALRPAPEEAPADPAPADPAPAADEAPAAEVTASAE